MKNNLKNNLKNKKKKGFTLIELIIVIAIIAIIAAIAIPRFGGATNDAKAKSDLANAKTIANAAALAITEGEKIINDNGKDTMEVKKGTVLDAYLQGIPKTSDKGSFYIKVDASGDVVVFTDADGTNQIYPED